MLFSWRELLFGFRPSLPVSFTLPPPPISSSVPINQHTHTHTQNCFSCDPPSESRVPKLFFSQVISSLKHALARLLIYLLSSFFVFLCLLVCVCLFLSVCVCVFVFECVRVCISTWRAGVFTVPGYLCSCPVCPALSGGRLRASAHGSNSTRGRSDWISVVKGHRDLTCPPPPPTLPPISRERGISGTLSSRPLWGFRGMKR